MEPIAANVKPAVDTIRKRIQQIRDRNELIGEQNTKAALIDPLLSALGWDLHEIDEVRREYRRKPQDNPVDYALFLVDTLLFLSKEKMRGSLLDEMWKAHFIDRKVRLAFEGLLGEDDGALVRAICKKANGVTHTEVRAALMRAKISVD